MRHSIIRATFGAIALIATTGHALAQAALDFTLDNQTGSTVVMLNVSPAGEMNWGPDFLGSDVLAAGQQAAVTFPATEAACEWDIRVTYDDGDTGEGGHHAQARGEGHAPERKQPRGSTPVRTGIHPDV